MVSRRRVKKLNSKAVGFGELAEEVFSKYLVSTLSHKVLLRNFYYRLGEIDLISFKDGVIYFWEVKARHGDRFGYPEEAVDNRKIERIERGIDLFFQQYPQLKKYEYLFKIAALTFDSNDRLVELKVFELV